MLQATQVEKKLYRVIEGFLITKGFAKGDFNKYVKKQPRYLEDISFRVLKVGLNFGVKYNISRSYFLIENVWKDLKDKYKLTDTSITIIVDREKLNPMLKDNSGYAILNSGGIFLKYEDIDNELEKFKNLFIKEYDEMISPFLKITESINWMDEILNLDYLDFKRCSKFFP